MNFDQKLEKLAGSHVVRKIDQGRGNTECAEMCLEAVNHLRTVGRSDRTPDQLFTSVALTTAIGITPMRVIARLEGSKADALDSAYAACACALPVVLGYINAVDVRGDKPWVLENIFSLLHGDVSAMYRRNVDGEVGQKDLKRATLDLYDSMIEAACGDKGDIIPNTYDIVYALLTLLRYLED